jgi:sulfite exporter TauE/SafE
MFMYHMMIGFMGGLLAFPHCVGMCGGFMVHVSGAGTGKRSLTAPLTWLAGKTVTYVFSGALAGFAGAKGTVLLHQTALQHGISYLAGAIILLAGLSLLGLIPTGGTVGNSGLLVAVCRPLVATPSPAGALGLGMVAGLLPCPITIGFLAYAMQSGSVMIGLTTMAAVGLGTVVPLLLIGGLRLAAGPVLKRWGASVSGIVLVVLGLTTALRGTEVLHRLLGCPAQPVFQQSADNGGKGCCSDKGHGSNGN